MRLSAEGSGSYRSRPTPSPLYLPWKGFISGSFLSSETASVSFPCELLGPILWITAAATIYAFLGRSLPKKGYPLYLFSERRNGSPLHSPLVSLQADRYEILHEGRAFLSAPQLVYPPQKILIDRNAHDSLTRGPAQPNPHLNLISCSINLIFQGERATRRACLRPRHFRPRGWF